MVTSPMMSRSEILTNVFTQLRNAGYVYNKTDFARHLRYDKTYMSSRFSGNREISDKTFARILKVFPQVNRTYLLTGQGQVLSIEEPRPRLFGPTIPQASETGSLLDSLIAERDGLQERLDRINQALDILCPGIRKAS